MACLKGPARDSFSFGRPFVLKWQIIFFLNVFCFLFFVFFYFFCQKLAIFVQIWKIKMQIIATCSIWQQPSLVPTPQPVLGSFPCYTDKLYGTTVIPTSRVKNKT